MCILAYIDVKYNLHEMNYCIEHVLSFCAGYNVSIISLSFLVVHMLNKNSLAVKEVRGQSEATIVISN